MSAPETTKRQRNFVSSDAPASIAPGPVTLIWEYPADELPKVIFTVWTTADLAQPFVAALQTTNLSAQFPRDMEKNFFRVSAEWKL